MVSSVYLSKFKIIETCLFLALFCLCILVILMALFKSHFLLILSFLTAKFGGNFFIFVSINILFDRHFNQLLFRVLFHCTNCFSIQYTFKV